MGRAALNAIEEFLVVDRHSPRPVFVQLRDGFARWIDTLQEGDCLPSERAISTAIGLNRITVRKALEPLVREGLISKSAGRTGGMVVTRQRAAMSYPIHPLLMNESTVRTLTLATFEYTPAQHQSWAAIFRRYEAENPGVKVIPVQVPFECDTIERYLEFIRSRSVDMFLISDQNLSVAMDRQVAAPLPEGLCRMARGPEFLQQALGPDPGEKYSHGIPLHVGLCCVVCNRELLRRAGCEFDPARDLDRLPECLATLHDRLPESTLLLSEASRLLLLRGIPKGPLDPVGVRRFCDDRLRYMERLHPVLDRCSWVSPQAESAPDAFLKGQMVFYVGTTIFVLGHSPSLPVEWNVGLIAPEPGCVTPNGACRICIRKDSSQQQEAGRFLEFLLSSTVQDLLPTGHFTCAFRASSNDRLAQAFPGVSLDTIHAYVRSMEPETEANGRWVGFLKYQFLGIVDRYFGGAISRDQALDEAVQTAPTMTGA